MKAIIEAARQNNLKLFVTCLSTMLRDDCDGAGIPAEVLNRYPKHFPLALDFSAALFRENSALEMDDEGFSLSCSFAGLGLHWIRIPWATVLSVGAINPSVGVWPHQEPQPEAPPSPPRGFRVIDGGKA